jgi:hypothetical protein
VHSNYLSSKLCVSIVYAHCTAAVVEDSAIAAEAELEAAVETAADTISEHCSCVLVFQQPQQCPITFLAPTADADSLYSEVFLRASSNSTSSSSSSSSSRRKSSGKGKASSSKQQQQQLEDAESVTVTTAAAIATTGSDDLLTDDTSACDVAAALRLPGFQVIGAAHYGAIGTHC